MTRVAIDLPSGLASNDTPYSNQGRWWTADKVRFRQGKAEVVGGWEAASDQTLTGVCRAVLTAKDNVGAQLIFLGTNSNLYVWRSGTLTDITPPGFVAGQADGTSGPGYGVGGYGVGPYGQYVQTFGYFPLTWSFAMFGESLIACPRGGQIYWWQNDATIPAGLLTDSADPSNTIPTQNNYVLVTERAIMSLGCNQQLDSDGSTPGPYNPRCIRVSDIDGNITDWSVSNTNNSYEYELDTGGALVAGANWGEVVAIWTEDALYAGQFVGNTGQSWSFTPVEGAVGLLGPNAQTVVGSTAYWISGDRKVWSCTVGSAPTQLYSPIHDDTLAQITDAESDKVTMCYVTASDEIRIDYPDARDGIECSRYLTLYLGDNLSWSQGVLARTAYAHSAPLPLPIGVGPPNANNMSTFYFHETSQAADGAPISWSITSTDFALDEDNTAMFVSAFYPDFIDQVGPVSLTIFGRTRPQSDEVAYGPFVIQPGQDKVDLRFTAKLCRLEFSGSASPTFCRIGRPTFEVGPAGTRP